MKDAVTVFIGKTELVRLQVKLKTTAFVYVVVSNQEKKINEFLQKPKNLLYVLAGSLTIEKVQFLLGFFR